MNLSRGAFSITTAKIRNAIWKPCADEARSWIMWIPGRAAHDGPGLLSAADALEDVRRELDEVLVRFGEALGDGHRVGQRALAAADLGKGFARDFVLGIVHLHFSWKLIVYSAY